MNESIRATEALARYGVENISLSNNGACAELTELLVRNYPCMKEELCTPFNTTLTEFLLFVITAMLIMFFIGWYLRGKKEGGK